MTVGRKMVRRMVEMADRQLERIRKMNELRCKCESLGIDWDCVTRYSTHQGVTIERAAQIAIERAMMGGRFVFK